MPSVRIGVSEGRVFDFCVGLEPSGTRAAVEGSREGGGRQERVCSMRHMLSEPCPSRKPVHSFACVPGFERQTPLSRTPAVVSVVSGLTLRTPLHTHKFSSLQPLPATNSTPDTEAATRNSSSSSQTATAVCTTTTVSTTTSSRVVLLALSPRQLLATTPTTRGLSQLAAALLLLQPASERRSVPAAQVCARHPCSCVGLGCVCWTVGHAVSHERINAMSHAVSHVTQTTSLW